MTSPDSSRSAQLQRAAPSVAAIAAMGLVATTTPLRWLQAVAVVVILALVVLLRGQWDWIRTGRSPAQEQCPGLATSGQHHVILVDAGDRPVAVVKKVRELTGYQIFQAKQLVDRGGPVASGLSRDGARQVAEVLIAVGAHVRVDSSA